MAYRSNVISLPLANHIFKGVGLSFEAAIIEGKPGYKCSNGMASDRLTELVKQVIESFANDPQV